MSVDIRVGDCLDVLRTLDAGSVQCCVTSPPYFGLRDYGHAGQIGLEPTPGEFVAKMVEVFREVRRVLADDGTLWLNIGDSYANDAKWGGSSGGKHVSALHGDSGIGRGKRTTGLPPKSLMGMPWRVALALQDDGWTLRSDIIWHKPNPMPERVKDRPTKAHEYLFLLTKSKRYYYDGDAICEPMAQSSMARLAQDVESQSGSERANGGTRAARPMKAVGMRKQLRRALELAAQHGLTEEHIAAIRACGISDAGKALVTTGGCGKNTERNRALAAEAKLALNGYYREFLIPQKRNKRSVWTVPTGQFSHAHFATFPPALIEPCILAGSRPGDTVLDPFGGAGTTGLVAFQHSRNALLIEINPAYAQMARERIHDDAPLFSGGAA